MVLGLINFRFVSVRISWWIVFLLVGKFFFDGKIYLLLGLNWMLNVFDGVLILICVIEFI